LNDLILLSNQYSSIKSSLEMYEIGCCKYQLSFVRGIKESLKFYEDDVKAIEKELVDPCLSLTAFTSLKKYSLIFEDIIKLIDYFETKSCLEVIDIIHRNSSSVNLLKQRVYKKIDYFAIRPLFEDIWYWIVYGHLAPSDYNKFFIKLNNNGTPYLEMSEVPSFISESLSRSIYFSGRVVLLFSKSNGALKALELTN